MPPHVSNLRLLFPSSFPLISPLKPYSFPFSLFPKPLSVFTVLASSSSSSSRRSRPFPQRPRSPGRRNASTFIERKTGERGAMEETESARFNKRRAEGGDKADKPKRQLHRKERKLNPSNTISYVQILGTGMDTQDTSPSVLLFFDKQRFIFNAGEGLQRFCTEHKIKLSKIDHIFLSRVCSETAGGLPGLLLTLAGMGEEGMSVNVWGPSDLKYLVDAMKSFIPNAAMVHTRSFGPSLSAVGTCMDDPSTNPIVLVDNEAVKISAIILQPSFSEGSGLTNASENVLEERMDSEPSTPKRKMASARKPGDMSVVYVCELPEIPGKFHPEKALAFGLKPGRKYGELQDGKSVMSDRQNIMVHPSDVMDPSTPGPIVILVDCPTESHLQELLAIQCLSNYYADFSGPPESAKVVTCIIHLSPASVVSSPSYQKWMRRFGSAQNIMAGHERENVEIPILKSSARVAARLNYLCPQFFPAPGFWSVKQLGSSAQDNTVSSEVSDLKPCEIISAKNLLKFALRPLAQLGVDRSGIPISMAPSEIIDELLSEIPDVSDAAQHVSQLWHMSTGTKGEISCIQDDKLMVEEPWLNENKLPSCLEDIRRDDMEIVLLGTGSSQPSKYRNVSSIHINLFSKGGLLLDCGEGTLGQLKRRYGVDGADEVVRGLRCIWISHIHADHHTGLARILALRRDLLKDVPHEPLLVVGPRQLKRYLDAYQRLEDIDMQFLDCKFTTEAALEAGDLSNFDDNSNRKTNGQSTQKIDSTIFAKGSRMQSYFNRPGSPVDIGAAIPILKSLKKMLSEAGLDALISFPVVHCPQAFGVVLKAGERINSAGKVIPGWKIVYSGDTRPCPELIEASRGATVLIHEATFEDGLVDEAIARNHSTTQEAIDVGNSARAYRIVLTHFSQRYPKIPVFGETHGHNTSIAFDLMSINLADLPVLPKVIPYLKLLFPKLPEEEAEEELGDVVSTL